MRRKQRNAQPTVTLRHSMAPDADERLVRAYVLLLRAAAQQQALADPPTATSTKEDDADRDSSADG